VRYVADGIERAQSKDRNEKGEIKTGNVLIKALHNKSEIITTHTVIRTNVKRVERP